MEEIPEFCRIESIFVRHRNCLLVRAQLTPIYTDYYFHLMQQNIRNQDVMDKMLKDAIAFFMLHLVARPWHETHAWTMNLRVPRANVFLTGSCLEKTVIGRVFTEDIREPDRNFLYAQVLKPNTEARLSTIALETNDPAEWVEAFYKKSEQREARSFRLEDEHFALLIAQPDADLEWMAQLVPEQIAKIEQLEEIKLLETRELQFHCGCTLEKILPALSYWKSKLDELFLGEDSIHITCPRCAAHYVVTREMLS